MSNEGALDGCFGITMVFVNKLKCIQFIYTFKFNFKHFNISLQIKRFIKIMGNINSVKFAQKFSW